MNNLSSHPGSPQTPPTSSNNGTPSRTPPQPQHRTNAFLFPNLLPTLSSPQFFEASRRSPSATRRSIFTVTSAMSQHMPRSSTPEASQAATNNRMTPIIHFTSPISSANISRVATPATSETTLDSGILSNASLMETESSVSRTLEDSYNTTRPQSSSMNVTEPEPLNEATNEPFQLDMSPIQPSLSTRLHHRHGSLEDLYRPTNHRSSATKKSKRKNKQTGLLNKYQSETSMHLFQNVEESDPASAVKEPTEPEGFKTKIPLLTKASLAFMLGAIRGLRQKMSALEAENYRKTRESAARSILHNLLLNTWRQCRKSSDKIIIDNQLHKRNMENMCLQLKVLRQMHRDEKQRSHERGVQVSELGLQIEGLRSQSQVSQSELEKVENELNNCQVQVETLQNLNNQMMCEKQALQERIVRLNSEKNEEIHKACRFEKEKAKVLEEVDELNQRLYDVTRSRNKWQEEAHSKDSEISGLKTDMCYKDKQILQVQNQNQGLLVELNECKQMKVKHQMEEQTMLEKILQAKEEIQKLNTNAMKNEEALGLQNGMIEALRTTINQQQEKLSSTQDELSLCLRTSIEKRRKLADRFHYLVFPGDLLNLFYDSGNDKSRYAVDLKEITASS